jgi:single-stranded-DNA-specific exonuclease
MASHDPGAFVWKEEHPDPEPARQLARALGCPAWLAALLIRRGLDQAEAARNWLTPKLRHLGDPMLLPDAGKAASRILKAIAARERITVFGDYDVDGLTSTALLHDLLTRAGAKVATFLPLRMEEGYGLSAEALLRCLEETQPQLIITVDCGTTAVDSVAAAQSAGIDVIVTDHHEPGTSTAPAFALVNPRLSSDATLHGLAGVGVAFKLAHAVLKLARQQGLAEAWVQTDPRDFLDLVALGTVADLVPLTHENRILVHYGLKHLTNTHRTGIRALIDVAKITRDIDTYEVGFLLGPRLNASGRLGNARMSLQLLMTNDAKEAGELAVALDAANRERQQVEKTIVEELKARISARDLVGLHAIVEAEADWHPGVVGIVASRLVQQFYRPSIVIGMDDQGRAKGSCRSIAGLNITETLTACREHLVKFGGHAMAAGIEVEWDRLPAFRAAFEQACRERLAGRVLQPGLAIDGWVTLDALDAEAVRWLDGMRPFGMGNPEPVWAARALRASGTPREVGTGHLKLVLMDEAGAERSAIGFGMFHRPVPPQFDGAFQVRVDTFRGRSETVLHLKDFRESQPA